MSMHILKPLLVVVNWKMELTHEESLAFLHNYLPLYEQLLPQSSVSLVVCPSFTVLSHLSSFKAQWVQWGAQNCAAEERGAYTGEVSVLSLKELGITAVLVGHSEQRRFFGETDERVARKAELLMRHSVCPIVCIGENEQEKREGATFTVLARQLSLIKELKKSYPEAPLMIAYEPVWAIGTGLTPSQEELVELFSFMIEYTEDSALRFLYGGSVTSKTRDSFANVPLDGYLLGRQGLDGEMLKKIILLW